MNKIIIITFLLFPFFNNAQEVLLEETPVSDSLHTNFGQNYKNYGHFFLSTGFIAGQNNSGSEIIYGLSRQFNFGYRYKRRVTNYYALGFEGNISNSSFQLKQNSTKILPNDSIHTNERISVNALNLEFYNRFNFGKRGNIIGRFIDLGFFVNYNYKVKNVVKDVLPVQNLFSASKVKEVYTGLNYIENLGYGISVRVGINRYVLFTQYRLSNLVANNGNLPELPGLIIGFQIGLH
ncbi:MAG: hypothetical protein GXO79_03945 [Chlorobi bacterium]|nr:hypothetical protein [Chlorobiota bacterium]